MCLCPLPLSGTPPLCCTTGPQVRKSIIGFDVEGLNTSAAWEAGFGSLYWMEGVATRLADRHGGEPMHVAGWLAVGNGAEMGCWEGRSRDADQLPTVENLPG